MPGNAGAVAPRRYVLFQVAGMSSWKCARKVEGTLVVVPGVVCAKVDLAAGTARVLGSAPLLDLEAAITASGYTPLPGARIRRVTTEQLAAELDAAILAAPPDRNSSRQQISN